MPFAGPLVVVVLVAFLNATGRRDRLPAVGFGVLAAVPPTAAAWFASAGRPGLFEAAASLAAVAGVGGLILGMRPAARTPYAGRWAAAAVAFLATVSTGVSVASLIGAAAAIAIGWAATTATAGTDPRRLFAWAGALLIPVAAGLLQHGVHGLQRAGVLPGADRVAFDLRGLLDPASWYASLLSGALGLTPRATVIEAGAWLAFAMVMTALFFRRDGVAILAAHR